jgi:membrane-bound lytic murein transglycosylase D
MNRALWIPLALCATVQSAHALDGSDSQAPSAAGPVRSRTDGEVRPPEPDATGPGETATDASTQLDQAPTEDPLLEGKEVEVNEMEDLKAVEDATIDDRARSAADLLRTASRLGAANALGDRVDEALRDLPSLPADAPSAGNTGPEAFSGGIIDVDALKSKYDIPIELQPLVWAYVRFFQNDVREHFVKWLSRASRYDSMMRATLKARGLPEDTVYLAMIESGFSPYAYSRARAAGMWQFIAATGKRFGLKMDFWVDERRDPVKSTDAAARYLTELYHQFGDWRLAWAGYNAGGGRVAKAIQRQGSRSFWDLVQGHVLHKETKHYVPKLIAAALISKQPHEFGFTDAEIDPQKPLAYDEVPVTDAVDLEVLAHAAGISADDLRDLNPELRRWCTPPAKANAPFMLRVPKGTGPRVSSELAKLSPTDRLRFVPHVVQRGETLSKIAALYGSVPEAIMHLNGMMDSRRLRLGTELVIPVPANTATARGRLAASSRRRGYSAAPAAEEIPAGPPPKPHSALAGSVRVVKDGTKDKVLYGVAQGDSLWAIGQRFGVSPEQLREWNGLSRRRAALQVGRELTIFPPAGFDVASVQATAKP